MPVLPETSVLAIVGISAITAAALLIIIDGYRWIGSRRKPVVRLLRCHHYRDADTQRSILEIDFELNNPKGDRTSIRELRGWILDGPQKRSGELESLWDYRTLARIRNPYNPNKRPNFEKLQLPHSLAEPTERYVAFFQFTEAIATGEDSKCGMIVIHTHGQESLEGISHPTFFQRAIGSSNVEEGMQHNQLCNGLETENRLKGLRHYGLKDSTTDCNCVCHQTNTGTGKG